MNRHATVIPKHSISFEEGWNVIHNTGIRRLFSIIEGGMKGKISHQEFVIIYTTVYNMCLQKKPKSFAHELYGKYCDTIKDHLRLVSKPAIFETNKHNEYMLIELVNQYRSYKYLVKWLIASFGYLDRQYVKRYHKRSLTKVATQEFRDEIFSTVQTKCLPVALELIEQDRAGKSIDRSIIRDFIHMFIDVRDGDIRTYKQDFEAIFLTHTTEYYLKLAQQMLCNLSCSEYLFECEQIIKDEQIREKAYLHKCTHNELLKRLYSVLLVTPQMKVICMKNTGVYDMMKNDNFESLSRLFKLYSCVPNTLPKICAIISKRIQDEGIEKLQRAYAQKSTRLFVETLIELYASHEKLIANCFVNHADFSKALKDGYSAILNSNSVMNAISNQQQPNQVDSNHNNNKNRPSSAQKSEKTMSELLSTYIDLLMRVDGNIKLSSDAELEARLQTLVKIFSYLYDKDVFLEFYRKQLAKRLLTSKSNSEYLESAFISQLKLRCGAQFTSKLEGMIKDIGRSRDHEIQFCRYLARRGSGGKSPKSKTKAKTGASASAAAAAAVNLSPFAYEFNCKVLTSGFWPRFPEKKLLLPRSMMSTLDYFSRYFVSLHQKRLLTWIHELGTVQIMAHFDAKSVVLEVSTLQACILLILNQIDRICIQDITRMLCCHAKDIKTQLKPLCSKKYHVLNKEPLKGYNVSHFVSMNVSWNPSAKRHRIPSGVHRITHEHRKENIEQVIGDRKFIIEACVVRIMKARKLLKHNNLIAEVSAQLMHRFRADPKQIKLRILDLIEREYLSRDENDSHTYCYEA